MKPLTRQEEQILLIIHHLKKNNAYLVNIRQKYKIMTGKYLDVGTIYVPLKRLSLYGYLKTHLGEPTAIRGGKAIKYYSLTPQGYKALEEAKKVQDKLWEGVVFPHAKA